MLEPAGAYIKSWNGNTRVVEVVTTPWPSGSISVPNKIEAGEPVNIQINGTSYVAASQYRGLKYWLWAGNTVIDQGEISSNNLNKSVRHTFPADGSYQLWRYL
ncbi:MAG: hypothetical protein AB1420_05530 [Bacillota bacterium]